MGSSRDRLDGKSIDPENPCGPVLMELRPPSIRFYVELPVLPYILIERGERNRTTVVQRDLHLKPVDLEIRYGIAVGDIAIAVADGKLSVHRYGFPLTEPTFVVELLSLFELEDFGAVLSKCVGHA